jgi:hypothetical protein
MQNIKRKSRILILGMLCAFGIAACVTTTRNLDTLPPPERPLIFPEHVGANIVLPQEQFMSLTRYVIELSAQLEKCNAQAEVFN